MIVEEEQTVDMNYMIRDAAGPSFDWEPNSEEEPNYNAKSFLRMMDSANEKVYPGAKSTVLESVAELLNIKADSNMSQHTYNRITAWAQRTLLPEKNNMVANFYDTKKLVGHISLGYEKIDCCRNQCMLFYKEDGLQSCSVCGLSRYKSPRRGSAKHKKNMPHKQLRYMPLIPRLQCLYASKVCSEAMRWHKESPREEGVMTHPLDGEAWKNFDATYIEFAADARNIRLGICSDGFTPFGPAAKSDVNVTHNCLMMGASGTFQQHPQQQNQWPLAMFSPQQQLLQPLQQPHSGHSSASPNSYGRGACGNEGGGGSGGGNIGSGIFVGVVGNTFLLEMLTDPNYGRGGNGSQAV
ncbi:hypothetical protein OROMI_002512 [Orobanche minor]